MKATLLTGFGGPDMLRYGDAPDPVAGPGEVVVDVYAASVNAADYKLRLGSYSSSLKFPHILGRDFPVRSAPSERGSTISRWATAMSRRRPSASLPRTAACRARESATSVSL